MPIIKSAVKRARQTKSRTARNNTFRRNLKAAQRELDGTLASGNKKNLLPLLAKLQSELDRAVKKNLMHKNKAARNKRRYAALVKDAGAKPAGTAKKAKKPAARKTPSKAKK